MSKDRIWTLLSRKLSGEATGAELHELDEILNNQPDAAIPVHLISEHWNIAPEADEEFLEATYHLHTQRLMQEGYDLELNRQETGSLNLETTPRFTKKNKLFALGAMAVLVAAVFFFTFFNNTASPAVAKAAQSEVSTKNGSRSKITLPDGTSVWLNSDSKLVYDNENFGSSIREVSLTGEAYFDVIKNPAKPFIIHAAKMDIRVLGTAFNVKSYPGDKTTETSLIRGSVEVTLKDRPEKIIMKPNEKLIINNDDYKPVTKETISRIKQQAAIIQKSRPIIELGHLTLFPKDNSIVETGWVENRLVFSNETLEEIAVKMERWYGVTIVIASEKLKKEQLTGIFEKETVYQALNALQITTPFTYKVDKDVITISK